jgi:hypothetical protein
MRDAHAFGQEHLAKKCIRAAHTDRHSVSANPNHRYTNLEAQLASFIAR